jgi:hypothetical protein
MNEQASVKPTCISLDCLSACLHEAGAGYYTLCPEKRVRVLLGVRA